MIADGMPEMGQGAEVRELVERLARGETRALARACSVVEDGGESAEAVLRECGAMGRRALRLGLTGAPGVGKSTLGDALVRVLRGRGKKVGVLAVDPTSPLTGGALLGDRIRMRGFEGDGEVFIRSMATRGALGGVARGAAGVCAVMEAAGCEVVVIETVGVGQAEVDVSGLADVTVVVLAPGMGDDVQSLKAGLMEVADVFAVNKADLAGAENVEREIVGMQGLAMAEGWVAPVVRTVASTGAGVHELLGEVERCARERERGRAVGGVREMVAGAVRLDHLGVAVRSLEAAQGFYQLLGLRVGEPQTVEHEGVRVAMIGMGESRVELLEALAEETVIGRFLAKRGEGLHHVALRVEGIEEQFARLRAAGVRLVSDQVRTGAGGHRYFFVHPAATGGVLVELVEE